LTKFDLPPPPDDILNRSLREAAELFLTALAAAGASPKTVKAYRAAINDFVSFVGEKKVSEVTSSDVASWIRRRLSEGVRRPRDTRGDVRATMHYYTLFLRSFLKWSRSQAKVPVVKKPRSKKPEVLNPQDLQKLLAASRDELDFLIVALLFETGLRAQEAVELRVEDIDFHSKTIRVRAAKYGEERIVPYGPLTERALTLWLSKRGAVYGEKVLGISYSGLYKRLKSLAKRAGVDPKKVRPHVLRHTFATEAIRRGIPLPVVQRMLGHHDVKVTQIYLHLASEDVYREYWRAFWSPNAAPPTPWPAWQQPTPPQLGSPAAPAFVLQGQTRVPMQPAPQYPLNTNLPFTAQQQQPDPLVHFQHLGEPESANPLKRAMDSLRKAEEQA
jgi:integrase/recombinase XerD